MIEDLKFLDTLAAPGSDGWYTDSPRSPSTTITILVFASHFLYWNKVVGAKYPEWSAKFTLR